MTSSLVEKYQMGMITDDHLVVESLHILDPNNPGLVLSALPDNLLPRVLRFVKDYLDGRMLTNFGAMPARDQVLAARTWIEVALQHTAGKPA
jgi:hypothetical protein